MSEKPSYMPSDRVIYDALDEARGKSAWNPDPVRALITAAVEKALAEQNARVAELEGEVAKYRDAFADLRGAITSIELIDMGNRYELTREDGDRLEREQADAAKWDYEP